MSAYDVAYGVVVPGLGHPNWGATAFGDGWAVDRPVCFYVGNEALFPKSTYILVPALLSISELGTRIDPRSAVIDAGSQTFDMVAHAVEPYNISGATVSVDPAQEFSRRVREADGLLYGTYLSGKFGGYAGYVSPTETYITLWSRNRDFSAGQIVYIEDEAIYLESLDYDDVVNNVQTFVVQRGVLGTTATAHQNGYGTAQGDAPDITVGYSNRVFTDYQPRNNRGGCHVIEADPNGDMSIVWRGFFRDAPSFDEGMSTISVEAIDVFSPFFGRKLNKEPHGAEWNGLLSVSANGVFNNPEGNYKTTPQGHIVRSPWSIAANHVSRSYGPAATGANPRTAIQLDSAIVSAEWDSDTKTYKIGPAINGGLEVSEVLMATPLPDSETEKGGDPGTAYEVLIGGKEATAYGTTFGGTEVDYTCIATGDSYLHHNLATTLAFILSTGRGVNDTDGSRSYDLLSLKTAMGIPQEFVDVDGWEAEMAERPHTELYQWAFGYDGSSYSWSDIRAKFLVPFGDFVHPGQDYKISVSRLRPVYPGQTGSYTTFESNQFEIFTENQQLGWDETLQTLEASGALPWHEKRRLIVAQDLGQGVTIYDPEPLDPELQIDVSALRPVDMWGNGEMRDRAERVREWYQRPIPTVKVNIVAPTTRPYPGMKVKLEASEDNAFAYRNPDGEVWEEGGQDDIYGLIVQVDHDYNSPTFVCQVLQINDPFVTTPKTISYSFEVSSYDSGTNSIILAVDDFGNAEDLDALSEVSGHDIEIWNRDGTIDVYSTNGPYTQAWRANVVSAGYDGSDYFLEVSADFDGTAPTSGDIVRVARRQYDDYYSKTSGWVCMAGNREIFSDGDRGDIYI